MDNKIKLIYTQASSINIKEILKIKNNFSNLLIEKIEEINKTINSLRITKSCFNITTKGLSYKQIIIFIGKDNIDKFMTKSDKHISSMNKALKGIKSNTIIDFIHFDHHNPIVTTN